MGNRCPFRCQSAEDLSGGYSQHILNKCRECRQRYNRSHDGPADDTKALPEPYATAAKGLNTASTDTVQWLLFSKDGEAERVTVTRTAVDFCHDTNPVVEYQHTHAWRAEKSDGTWLMTAVGPQIPE